MDVIRYCVAIIRKGYATYVEGDIGPTRESLEISPRRSRGS